MAEDAKAPEPPAPQAAAPAKPRPAPAKPAETPERRNVVILAEGVTAWPRGKIVRIAATDAAKLCDDGHARYATPEDIALAPPSATLED